MGCLSYQLLDLSVDLRDAIGDRLFLSGGLRRDGVRFSVPHKPLSYILTRSRRYSTLARQPRSSMFTPLRRLTARLSNTSHREHSEMLSARQAIAQSRRSRGFFDTLFRRSSDGYRPTYNYQADGSACRVYGTLEVKKVTGTVSPLFSYLCLLN